MTSCRFSRVNGSNPASWHCRHEENNIFLFLLLLLPSTRFITTSQTFFYLVEDMKISAAEINLPILKNEFCLLVFHSVEFFCSQPQKTFLTSKFSFNSVEFHLPSQNFSQKRLEYRINPSLILKFFGNILKIINRLAILNIKSSFD